MKKQKRQQSQKTNDDAIASLMKEMSQQQGYNNDISDNKEQRRHHHHHQLLQLLPELPEYPNNSYCPGNQSIWNPYVQSSQSQHFYDNDLRRSTTTTTTTTTTLPTNPQIEIIRRRCYEKFKKESLENLSRIIHSNNASNNNNNNNNNNNSLSSSASSSAASLNMIIIWKNSIQNLSTSIPSMLEKWHMDSKLQERQQVVIKMKMKFRRRINNNNDDDSSDEEEEYEGSNHHHSSDLEESSCFFDPNTSRIYKRTIQQQQQQQQHSYYDPILPSKSASSLFKFNFKSEMTKAITTTIMNNKNKNNIINMDDNNNNSNHLLPNDLHKLVDKKCKQIQKMLYKLTCEVLESYPQQIQKAVIVQQQQQQQQSSSSSSRRSSSGKKKKRRKKGNNYFSSSSSFKIQVTKVSRGSTTTGIFNDDDDDNNNDDNYDNDNNKGRDKDNHQIQLSYSGISYRVHVAYYEKLQRLYDRATNKRRRRILSRDIDDDDDDDDRMIVNEEDGDLQDDDPDSYRTRFHEVLYCLLCRYDMLQGAGLQAGVPGRVMDVIQQEFDCRFECFASPLNCRYESYCSVFDIDILFGSVGNFFDIDFTSQIVGGGGCYQANPPFCEELIGKMNTKIHTSLQQTTTVSAANTTTSSTSQEKDDDDEGNDKEDETSIEEEGIPLMFIVFVPAWKQNSDSYQALLENPFLTHNLILEQGKHWYTEGTQHRRNSSFRVASFDTSVLFYQNTAAKIKWPISPNKLDLVKSAFCEDPGIMDKTKTTTTTKILTKKANKSKQNNAPASTTTAAETKMQSEQHGSMTELGDGNDDDHFRHSKSQVWTGTEEEQNEIGTKPQRHASQIDPPPTAKQLETTHHHHRNNHQKKKKEKGKQKQTDGSGKKRKKQWMEDRDESTAQLDLLQSLGLASSPSVDSTKKQHGSEAKNKEEESNNNKQRGKKNKRRRKKQK